MIQHQGIWLPDGEKHMVEWMDRNGEIVDGKGTYQIRKLRAALAYVTSWGCAVDVGAHVGFWSMHLSKRFARVIAFEPVAEFRACFRRNLDPIDGRTVELYAKALGRRSGRVAMRRNPESSGDTSVVDGDEVEMLPLAALEFPPVDFVKIDCEGFEEAVVRGGEALIRRHKPVVCIEQKPHVMEKNFGTREPKAVRLLESWGYRVREELSGDFILTAA